MTDLVRKKVIYHELGHCEFDLEHPKNGSKVPLIMVQSGNTSFSEWKNLERNWDDNVADLFYAAEEAIHNNLKLIENETIIID
jgi:hypothetical protein